MHSSRMRTTRFSGRLGESAGGVHPHVHNPPVQPHTPSTQTLLCPIPPVKMHAGIQPPLPMDR